MGGFSYAQLDAQSVIFLNHKMKAIMKKGLSVFVIASAALLAAGCSTTSGVAHYKASTKNVLAIQDHVGDKKDIKVRLNDFTAAQGMNDTQMCRAMGTVSVGGGHTPSQFIQEAMQEELYMAQVYSNSAPVVISGRLDSLKFSSVSPANWEIALTLTSSNGTSYQTVARHDFDTSWDAISACKNVSDAFPMAVQATLKRVFSDARFKALIAAK